MYRSRSRSCTSALLLAGLLAACGGGDGDVTCGPGDAPADGITLSGEGIEIRYRGFLAGPNNDCPDPGDPSPPTSLTIVGTQADSGAALVLCVSRPDRFGDQATSLGTAIVVEDADGVTDGCMLNASKDTAAPTGNARAEGYCADGEDPAGFALVIDGEVDVAVRCGDTEQTRRLRLSGRAAVGI